MPSTSAPAALETPAPTQDANLALEVSELSVRYGRTSGAGPIVDCVSLTVGRGEAVGLVGESGCGKSSVALAIGRLLPAEGAAMQARHLRIDGCDVLNAPGPELRRLRGARMGMIFQEPGAALNPVYTIGEQIAEALRIHRRIGRRAAWSAAAASLERAGIPDAARRARDYPHQFSGGMQQRAMIAMATVCRPALLVADEPTSALDATVACQILDQLGELRRDLKMGLLLISHDLGAIARCCDRVYVMYAGRIVEHAPAAVLFRQPLHPYTQALIACAAGVHRRGEMLPTIAGTVPDPRHFPDGCRFHPRCPLATPRCATGTPVLESWGAGQFAACHEIVPGPRSVNDP